MLRHITNKRNSVRPLAQIVSNIVTDFLFLGLGAYKLVTSVGTTTFSSVRHSTLTPDLSMLRKFLPLVILIFLIAA